MWITVEKMRKTGDFLLGISQLKVKGFPSSATFPQFSPQPFFAGSFNFSFLVRKVFCNYIKVIPVTHLLTRVITTNYKYKSLSKRVPWGRA